MGLSTLSIEALVTKIKKEILSNLQINPYLFVTPSAYDTAWLAMISDPSRQDCPMFNSCLDWVLNNQKEAGFWGESNVDVNLPTIDTLPATLACLIALRKWDVGDKHIKKGLAFIESKTEELLKDNYRHLPRWFVIVFPAMLELAETTGLELVLPSGSKGLVADICSKRQQIFPLKNQVDELLYYLETLPSTYELDQPFIANNVRDDGSLNASPSATARAVLATGNPKCIEYLTSLVQRCPNGVPAIYPVDEELIKLCLVDQIQKFGLAEHFNEEIEDILAQINSYKNQESRPTNLSALPAKIYKDSLVFRLLRTQGYETPPVSFCWFLQHEEILDYMEQDREYLLAALHSVYRATDIMFSGEYELEAARSFSKKLLEKAIERGYKNDHLVMFPGLQKVIKYELSIPWIARLDLQDHRMWIEVSKGSPLWTGKASFYRLSCLNDENFVQLAVENYEFRQSIYRRELEEMKRWSKDWGLSDMGFGREKTSYCYFAIATNSSLPCDSDVRVIIAKGAVITTVADDFFDMKGSLDELQHLTEAVQRWDGKGLDGPSRTIFDALDNLVSDIAMKCQHQQGIDITIYLQNIWSETFLSWLTEYKWSKTGYIPPVDEYLQVGMTSIAVHAIVLPALFFLSQFMPNDTNKPPQYETITTLLMATARLLNDIQSYQKEQKEGTINLVLLHLKENPHGKIEDSISYVNEMLDKKRKELLKHALLDGFNDFPKQCKQLHLHCFKVFQMFFNSTNLFDSTTALLQDINKAIFIPPECQSNW